MRLVACRFLAMIMIAMTTSDHLGVAWHISSPIIKSAHFNRPGHHLDGRRSYLSRSKVAFRSLHTPITAEVSLAAAKFDHGQIFSLDKPAVPTRITVLDALLAILVAPVAVAASGTLLKRALWIATPAMRMLTEALVSCLEGLSSLGRSLQNIELPTASTSALTPTESSSSPSAASVRSFWDGLVERFERLYQRIDHEVLDLEDWQSCNLVSKDRLSPEFTRYRFRLPKPNQVIALGPGQEITLCANDQDKTVLKEQFFPVSPRNAHGYFEILVRESSTASNPAAAAAMEDLSIGQDVWIKAGRDRLASKGLSVPIESLQIVVSGEGVAAALQLLQSVLQPKDSTVQTATVLWLNEHNHQFVLAKEMEALARKFRHRVSVIPVVQDDLYGRDVTHNPQVKAALKPFTGGTMAVVCGQDYVVDKVARYLAEAQGYPADHVATIKC